MGRSRKASQRHHHLENDFSLARGTKVRVETAPKRGNISRKGTGAKRWRHIHTALFCFCYFYIFIGVQLLYNVVLLSAVQQSESAICVPISPLLGISFPFKSPQSIEQVLINYLFYTQQQWHPTPVLLPGKSHGRRSMVGCSPWGR